MRSIELFAGAAGLGLGLARAGFEHEIVVERDRDSCDTIRHNQKNGFSLVQGWKILEADVENLDFSGIRPEPSLLSGGPPCQPFSGGGLHEGADSERNMWPSTVRAVRTLQPRAFVFENVPGLYQRHRDYFDYLQLALAHPDLATPEAAGWQDDARFLKACVEKGVRSTPTYRVSVAHLTATDFGVAQKRSRVFIIGLREDVAGEWKEPEATHSADQLLHDKWISGAYWDRHGLQRPEIDASGLSYLRKHNQRGMDDLFSRPLAAHRTVRDAIGDLPAPMPGNSLGISCHEAAPREARAYKGHTGSPIDEPSKTLRSGVNGVSGGENMIDFGAESAHNRYRHFTVREAARIQGYDDRFEWPGAWSTGLKQLGNAVPVDLAHAVGTSIARALSS